MVLAGTAAGQTPTGPLLSWNDGPTKQAILDFVAEVTNPRSPNYVLPAERIVCSDNDGTLWPENPVPVQVAFAFDELKRLSPSHPEWNVILRLYSPLKPWFDKTWRPSEIELVE